MDRHLLQEQGGRLEHMKRAVVRKQYREALDAVRQNPTDEDAKLHLLNCLVAAVVRVEDPLTLGEEHRDALLEVMTMSPGHDAMSSTYFTTIFYAYYPHKVCAMFETFMKKEGLDQNEFMRNIFCALERQLFTHLPAIGMKVDDFCFFRTFAVTQSADHQHVCPCNEKEICRQFDFASFVLSACKPLHYGSSFDVEQAHSDPSFEVGHCSLFFTAVSNDLLEEARLLYETGAVNNNEFAFLAQTAPEIQKILEEDEGTSMATFLRLVMRQPRTLLSAASLEVARLLGYDARGRQDRAKSLGLPRNLYDEVMFIRQVSDYRLAVESRSKENNGEH